MAVEVFQPEQGYLKYFFVPTGVAATDTQGLADFLDYCATNGFTAVLADDFSMNPTQITVTGNLRVICSAKITNALGTLANSTLLQLTGTGTLHWHGGIFNGNQTAYNVFMVDGWAKANVHVNQVYSMLGTASSPGSMSGIWFNNVISGVISWDIAYDMAQGGATAQGSVPRVCSVSVTTGVSNVVIHQGRSTDVHGVIVVGNIGGGKVVTHGGVVKNAADNGVYNVGDAAEVSVYDMQADSVDELLVNTGTGLLSAYGVIGRNLSNAIGLGQSSLGMVLRDCDLKFASGVAPFKLRSDNVASGKFEITSCRIEATPASRMCDFGTYGTLNEFIDSGNEWIINYDSAVHTSPTIFSMTPGTSCVVRSDESSRWILKDASANISGITFFINVPTVTKASYWDAKHLNLTTDSTSVIRLNQARQQLFTFKNKRSLPSVSSETEMNGGSLTRAWPREVWGDLTVPSSGYWQAGSIIRNEAPTSIGATQLVCYAAGTPGSWHQAGPMYETGTFVPTVSFATNGNFSPTYTTQLADWTRIGNLVRVHIKLQFTTNAYTTASGAFRIETLPYTCNSNSGGGGITRIQKVTYGAGELQLSLYPQVGTTRINGYAMRSNATPNDLGTTNIPPSTTDIIIEAELTYQTSG